MRHVVRSASDFHLGADVVSSGGRKVGTLLSVVVDEESYEPRAIVVKEDESFAGRLLASQAVYVTDEVVIPMLEVASVTRDAVTLAIPAARVRREPPYLTYRLKPLTTGTMAMHELELITPGNIGTPELEQVANKAPGDIEIERGERVMLGSTGRRLGRVADILYDEGELIGIVMRPEGLFRREVVLPVRFIARADDMALFAQLTEADLEHLEAFAPEG